RPNCAKYSGSTASFAPSAAAAASRRSASVKLASMRGLEAIWMAATLLMRSSTGFKTDLETVFGLPAGGELDFLRRQAERHQPVAQLAGPQRAGLATGVAQHQLHRLPAALAFPGAHGLGHRRQFQDGGRRARPRPVRRAQPPALQFARLGGAERQQQDEKTSSNSALHCVPE